MLADQFAAGSLNVITLAEHPLRVWLYAVVPAIGLILSASFLLLPAWVGINLIELIVLIALAEGVFGWLLPKGPVIAGDPESVHGKTYLREDARVGYVLEPDDEARHRRMVGSAVDYDVRYFIDALGRRRIDVPHSAGADRFLLFFGDSNTFGEGLPQGATMPDEMQRRFPDRVAYNYGVHGYGIAQMLDVIVSRDLAREVGEQRGIAFYYFIPAHMARLVGSSEVSPTWGRRLSYYRLADGRPQRLGDFATGRRFQTLLYGLLQQSNLRAYFGLTFPQSYGDDDYALASALVAESRARLAVTFRLEDFYVVFSPTVGSEQASISRKLAAALGNRGIHVIDLTSALDLTDRRYRVADDDYHQSAEANRLIAARLANRLSADHPDLLRAR